MARRQAVTSTARLGRRGGHSSPHRATPGSATPRPRCVGERGVSRARPPHRALDRPRDRRARDAAPVPRVLQALQPARSSGARSRPCSAGRASAFAAVAVVEPDDVVELGRRDLEHERVLERGEAVNSAGRKRNAARLDLASSRARLRLPSSSERDLPARATTRPSPRGTGGSATRRTDEEELADVVVRLRPDELPSPRLLDLPWVRLETACAAVTRTAEPGPGSTGRRRS